MKGYKNYALKITACVFLLLCCILSASCGAGERSELDPGIYPADNVKYEYNEKELPVSATVFKGEDVFCVYEYVYGEDEKLTKRIEKDADGKILKECTYEDGEALESISIYSDDGAITAVLCYDEDGLVSERTNFDDEGRKTLRIEYEADGTVHLTDDYKYHDNGNIRSSIKTGKEGVLEELWYNEKGILTDKWEYTDDIYTELKVSKNTEYDEDGNVEVKKVFTYVDGLLAAQTAYDKDGKKIYYCTYNSDERFERCIDYDEEERPCSLKCYGEHGMVHYVIYEAGKTVSWSEYTYDENGSFEKKIGHSVEGIEVSVRGQGTEIVTVKDGSAESGGYGYVNGEEWECSYYSSVNNFFFSSSLIFEEGDTVSVDELMLYYTCYEMLDVGRGHELYEHLEQYRTGNDAYWSEISIPKEVVNAELEKHFAVKVDGSDSEYTDPENENCYLLCPYTGEMTRVAIKDRTEDGNRSTATYALYNRSNGEIYRISEICIENEDSEEDFKIIYVRKGY